MRRAEAFRSQIALSAGRKPAAHRQSQFVPAMQAQAGIPAPMRRNVR